MTDALQAWPEAVTIDTSGSVEDAVEAALTEVDLRPERVRSRSTR